MIIKQKNKELFKIHKIYNFKSHNALLSFLVVIINLI